MEGSEPEKEEGEIEDGEIIDSQDEEGVPEEQETSGRPTSAVGFDIMGMLQRDLENGVEGSVDGSTKKKKKKKKKRKRASQQDGENGPIDDVNNDPTASLPSKQQKQKKRKRYVDHDRIQEDENAQWLSHGKTFPRRPESVEPSVRLSQSPPLLPTPQQRSPSRSPPPPGLYDSPPVSSDEYEGPPNRGGHFNNRFSMNSANYEALGERDPSKPAIALGLDFRSQRKGMNVRRGMPDKRGKGRPKRRRKEQQRPVCKFYLDGKCSKGLDCGYSHDSPLVKKQELCKFYLNGFCAKSETCIFMHKFPCKFFHTGAKCYSADKCKFSHDQLTDEMKYVLQRYLEKEDNHNSGDDDSPPMPHRPSLLGSPPRHIKEMAASHDPLKKIPSLFDIEVKPPQNVVPPGNNQQQPQQQMRPNFYSEMGSPGPGTRPPLLPFPTSSFDPDQNDYPFEEDNMRPGYCQMGPNRGGGGGGGGGPRFGSPHRMIPFGNQQHQQGPPEPFMDIDERFPPMEEMMYTQDEDEEIPDMMGQQDQMGPNQDRQSFHPIPWRNLAIADVDMRQGPTGPNGEDLPDDHSRGETSNDRDASHSSDSDGDANKLSDGSSGGNILIPLHLPKKQRELFLRIQQQQRRAGSSQEDSDKGDAKKKEDEQPETKEEIVEEEESFQEDVVKEEEEVEDEEELAIKKAEKESWYSSDEDDDEDEDKPLTAVLKKLQEEPIKKQAEAPAPPVFNIAQMLQSIAGIGSAPADVKPPVAVKPELSRDPRAHRIAELRDPRSARNNPSAEVRDPRVRTRHDPRLVSNPVMAERPRFNPRFGPGHEPNHSNDQRFGPGHEPNHSSDQRFGPGHGFDPNYPSDPRFGPGPGPGHGPGHNHGMDSSHFNDPRFGPGPNHGHGMEPNHSSIQEVNFRNNKEPRRPPLLRTPPGPPLPCMDTIDPASNFNYSIPYRLHAIAVSQPNYSSVLKKTDPRLLQSDPRLKKRLAQDRRPSVESAVKEGKSRRPSTDCVTTESNKAPLADANVNSGLRKSEPQVPTPAELEPHIMASVKSELTMMANIKPALGSAANKAGPQSVLRPTIVRKLKGAPRASNLSIFEQVLQVTAMPPSPLMEVQEIQECDNIFEPKMNDNPIKTKVADEEQDFSKDAKNTVSSPDRPQHDSLSLSRGSFAALIELDDDSDSDGDELVIIEAKEEPEVTEEPEEPEVKVEPEVIQAPEVKEEPETIQEPEVKVVPQVKDEPDVKAVPQIKDDVKEVTEIKAESKVKREPKAKEEPKAKKKPAKESKKGKDSDSDDLVIITTKKAPPKKKAPTPKKALKRPAPPPTPDCVITGMKMVVKKPKLANPRNKTSMEHSSPLDFESALDGAKVKASGITSRSPKKTVKNTISSPKAAPKTEKVSPKTPKANLKAPKSHSKSPKSNPKPAKSSPKSPKNHSPKTEKSSSKTHKKSSKKSPKTPEVDVQPPKVIEKPPEEMISRPAIPKLVLKKVGKTVIKTTIMPPPVERTKPPSPPSGHDLRSLSTDQESNITDDNTCLKDIFMTIDPTASPFC